MSQQSCLSHRESPSDPPEPSVVSVHSCCTGSATSSETHWRSLELICGALPLSAEFDPHLDASEHVFVTTLIVDTKLQEITILYFINPDRAPQTMTHIEDCRPGFRVGTGQPDVVQERPRTAGSISDEELYESESSLSRISPISPFLLARTRSRHVPLRRLST